MSLLLSPAEAVLYRTGPNNITILFEATGPFDPARAFLGLHQMVDGAERFHRSIGGRIAPCFGAVQELDWAAHVSVLEAPDLTAAPLMAAVRRLRLDPAFPMWRAILVNPGGGGWSGLALHFDHAIADGTRISRHLTTRALPEAGQGVAVGDLTVQSLARMQAQADPRLRPPDPGLARLSFAGLARAAPDATGHSDALLRLGHRMLRDDPAFAALPPRRRNKAAVARIEALRSRDGALGNRARMVHLDPGQGLDGARALFAGGRTPRIERARMALARLVPATLLRPIVQAEFSQPGLVMTVVPVARRLPPMFGLDLAAIYPAAPVLGRPPLALTAVRTGDGFDLCVTAHGPGGDAVPGLSRRVADAMAAATR